MKIIKTFESFSNYPMGAANDPNAPWNQSDADTIRGIEIDSSKMRFDLLYSDYSEIAVLKDKKTGSLYALAFDSYDDDFKDYMEVSREYIGKDEDGFPEYEYDWSNAELDDDAIEGYVDDKVDAEGTGSGISDFEDGKVSLMDPEVAKEVEDFFEYAIKNIEKRGLQTNFFHKDKFAKYKDAIEFVKKFSDEIVNEAEGIHPAVRQKLLDYLKENPKATFAEAKSHIGDTLKGWNLSEEDFEEAKKIS